MRAAYSTFISFYQGYGVISCRLRDKSAQSVKDHPPKPLLSEERKQGSSAYWRWIPLGLAPPNRKRGIFNTHVNSLSWPCRHGCPKIQIKPALLDGFSDDDSLPPAGSLPVCTTFWWYLVQRKLRQRRLLNGWVRDTQRSAFVYNTAAHRTLDLAHVNRSALSG